MAREYTDEAGARCVEKTVTIRRPAIALYQAWRDVDRLSAFMQNVVSVTAVGEKSHWVVKAPGGTMEWDAELTSDVPSRLIAWRSLPNADVRNSGEVHFKAALQGRATEVRVLIRYEPPGGAVGAKVAALTGDDPARQLDENLYRFKQLMETGVIPSTEGQPRGEAQRSAHHDDDAGTVESASGARADAWSRFEGGAVIP